MHTFTEQLNSLIRAGLAEDIGDGDHSALSSIPANARGRAILRVKEEGILAGMEVARTVFSLVDSSAVFMPAMKDGDRMHPGDTAFEIEASVHCILKCERLVLNCMQRMSGIATLTSAYASKLQGFHTRLLDTRKTTPNFRLLEKAAVKIGGGVNHRMGLYDMIMLKDNHVDFCGSLENAIDRAAEYVRAVKPGLKIEIETRNLDEVKRAVTTGKIDRIMLDNFAPEAVSAALPFIPKHIETEASGGINLDNILDYAATGVDFVSVGGLIHQARSLDLSLKAIKN